MARKNAIIQDLSPRDDANILHLSVDEEGEIVINISADLNDDIRAHGLRHGLKQRISDGAAKQGATPGEKFACMWAIADMLLDGDWSKRVNGTGAVAGIIYRAYEQWALAQFAAKNQEISVELIRETYDDKSRSDQLKLRDVPAIAAIIAELKLASGVVSASINPDSLLDELGL